MNDSNMTKPVGIMPNHLDLREITFTNLLLLDFNPAEMESKYRVVFNRDMFSLPNKKAMEVVMHFLFTRLHPQLAYEEFRDCWPVRDKVLEQQFRKVCFNWVSRIQKEDPEARLPRIVQSLFHSPGGDRFYAFLHHFSLYVLTKVMQRDHGKMTSIPTFPTKTVHNHSFTQVMSRALEAHYVVLKKRFLEFTQHAVQVEHHWKEFALESTKEFRALMRKKRDLEKQVMELNGMIAPRGTSIGVKTDYQEEVEALKRTQELQKVRDLWAGIEEFYTVQAPQRRIVDSILQGEANKYEIDAADIQPRVPDMLLRDCEREIRKRNIQDTYVGGKVNLYSLLQLWNLSLSKIKEQICEDPLPSFEDHYPAVSSALHTHHAHLINTISLREAIQGTMPDMKESIEALKLHCHKNLEHQQNRPTEAPVLFKLGLVPPTPPVSFAAADTPAAERITSFNSTLQMSPDTISTPDVIHAWTKSARRQQTNDLQESAMKPPKPEKAEPSRLPRPKPHSQLANQTRGSTSLTSKSTQKKKKKPSTGSRSEKGILYPHYVTPRTQELKKKPEVSSPVLKPHTILADQIADAVAMEESTSSFLSSSTTSSKASTPKPQALQDPVGALGQDAFQRRDLIPRTPAKTESEVTLSQPKIETKPGRLLETILDESTVTTTPSPDQGKHLSDPLPQAELSWSDIKFIPVSIKSPLLSESPPEHGPLSIDLDTVLRHTDSKHSPDVATDDAFTEDVSLNHSFNQPTPRSVKKSLFEDSPSPDDNWPRVQQPSSSHEFTRETPGSSKAPLAMGPSPRLDFWLLPQNGHLSHSGIKATPIPARAGLFEGTPYENDNSPFGGVGYLNSGYLNRTGGHFKAQTEKTKSKEGESQAEPLRFDLGNVLSPATQATPLKSPLARHTTPKIAVVSSDHELDMTELAKRLDMINQPTLQHGTWGLQPSSFSIHSETQHTPNSSGKQFSPSSSLSTHIRGQTPQDGIPSDQRGSAMTPSAAHPTHLTPKQPTVPKETSFQNVSSKANEVDTSALIQRLNRIKLTQQSFSSPHFTQSRIAEASVPGGTPRKENVADTATDTSLLASRLDQIKQAQKSQQVTPGANTDGDLSTSRTSEPALLTPLTPSSRDTPSDDGTKNEVVNFSFDSPQQLASFSDSPSSPVDRNLLLQWPFQSEEPFTTPPPVLVDVGADLGLVEGLQWETATPSLPQRRVVRTGLTSEEKSSVVPMSNGLRSPVFDRMSSPPLVNSVQRPEQTSWVPGSSQTPAGLGGCGQQGVQDESPHPDLASPFSYRQNAPDDLTSLWQDVPQSPLIGQLIDLE